MLPTDPIDRANLAYMFYRAYAVGSDWQLYGLAAYKSIAFPALSERQKQIARFALKFVGYPYIWAGEYPTPNSPYGTQKCGGFDCSGFVFYVMRMHFGYTSITLNQRGAHDMAAVAKPRITRDKLKCGDLIFFGPKGPELECGLHLPRRSVPGPRLVHPLHRLERRGDPAVAQRLQLLQVDVRLGPPGAQAVGARRGPAVAVAVAVGRSAVVEPTPTPQAPDGVAVRVGVRLASALTPSGA